MDSLVTRFDSMSSMKRPVGLLDAVKDVAEEHECVTVFFSDLVGFSTWSSGLPAGTVLRTLNDLYTRLDDIILNEEPSLYKVSSNVQAS